MEKHLLPKPGECRINEFIHPNNMYPTLSMPLGETEPAAAEAFHGRLSELNALNADVVTLDKEPAARALVQALADSLSDAAKLLTQEQILLLIRKIDDRELQQWINEEIGRNRREKAGASGKKRVSRITKPEYDIPV